MAATGTPTPNIGLRIPVGTDPASVDDINYNSNLLDTKLGPVGSDSVQDQIDTLNGKFSPSINAVDPYGQWTSYTGGYYSIGKIVIVQVTAVAGNFGANDYFTMTSSLPVPAYSTALSITTTSDNLKGAEAYVDATGKLIVKSGSIALTGQRVVVTGCYIKQ